MSKKTRFWHSSLLLATILLGCVLAVSATGPSEVEKRGGGHLFGGRSGGPFGEPFGVDAGDEEKRGGGRLFVAPSFEDKRGGGRFFAPSPLEEKRGGGRGFQLVPSKKLFSDWYLLGDDASEEKRAGARTFPVSGDDSKEKRAWEELQRFLP
ncbi:hypothetical protein QR680_012880 [Steinernema hermaphroditum]|uniref:Uncharacterized protein n=1 Tax=Steinernema hermaphroditum TaxID=289476 RepID=A0AA39I587_9BILA|nr:hypothetical protein QR680_012880 [Steinernema hermaphroditum]